MALNGPSYPGSGPNIIKEFRPGVNDGISTIASQLVDALIYPNPSSDIVNIQVSEALLGGDYKIIDYTGRTVHTGTITASIVTINVSNEARGSYYLYIQNGKETITRTFTLN